MKNNHLEEVDEFINENELFSFDALIEIEFQNGDIENAVYITTVPELLPSIDGTFGGEAEKPLFYLLNKRQYRVIEPAEIISLELLKKDYLKNSENKPLNFIELLDGRKIEAFPKAIQVEEVKPKIPALERRPVQMLPASSKPTIPSQEEDEKKRELSIFLKNAFFFYENRERILTDSRMFLAHVPVQSGLIYIGVDGFLRPTLGVYLQWWETCLASSFTSSKNGLLRVFLMEGSPLSGTNTCYAVNSSGNEIKVNLSRFIDVWSPFRKINIEYTDAKNRFEAYTLEEVVNLLSKQ